MRPKARRIYRITLEYAGKRVTISVYKQGILYGIIVRDNTGIRVKSNPVYSLDNAKEKAKYILNDWI